MFYISHLIENKKMSKMIGPLTLASVKQNDQPWRFYIVEKNREDFLKFLPYNRWLRTAPYLLIVYKQRSPYSERAKEIAAIDAAIENMLLEEQADCITSYWLGEGTARKEQINNWTGIHDAELVAVVAFRKKKGITNSRQEKLCEVLCG